MISKENHSPDGPAHSGLNDLRQSHGALAIARGTMRLLARHGLNSLKEVTLPSGRRADIVAISEHGEIWIVEIKSSREDFRADQKWPEYQDYCDRFFFAVDNNFPDDLIPVSAGLILADRFGAAIIRQIDADRLPAARRKALTLRLARLASARLHALDDPGAATSRG